MPTLVLPDKYESFTIDQAIDNQIQLRCKAMANTNRKRDQISAIFDEHLPIFERLKMRLMFQSGFELTYDETLACCLFGGIEMAFVPQDKGGFVLNSVRPVDVVIVDRQIKIIEMLGDLNKRVIVIRPQ